MLASLSSLALASSSADQSALLGHTAFESDAHLVDGHLLHLRWQSLYVQVDGHIVLLW